jgi:hypothetical protein
MGVPLDEWIKTIRRHPLKYKFDGLEDGGWHKDVREAAVFSESYMDDYAEKETDYYAKYATTEFSETYADWLRREHGHEWDGKKNINHCADSTVIRALGTDQRAQEWAYWYYEPDWSWEGIRADDPEYLLKEHPPIECWSHAYESGVPVEDVFFLCPSCGNEPTTEEETKDRFYCGLCGASSCLGPGEDIVDFIIALDLSVYPFNSAKHAEWKAKIEARNLVSQ